MILKCKTTIRVKTIYNVFDKILKELESVSENKTFF